MESPDRSTREARARYAIGGPAQGATPSFYRKFTVIGCHWLPFLGIPSCAVILLSLLSFSIKMTASIMATAIATLDEGHPVCSVWSIARDVCRGVYTDIIARG